MTGELKAPEARPWKELAVCKELIRLPFYWRRLKHEPHGASRVVVAPGFLTSDRSTWPLRRALSALGHEVHKWGLGFNDGQVYELLPRLVERIRKLAVDGPLRVVGWSLGGTLLREVAREAPETISQVITLGSPIVGGPKYTVAARYYKGRRGVDLDQAEREVDERERTTPIRVPQVTLYSQNDNIVCPAACIDTYNKDVQHIEVSCCHTGFGLSPEVLQLLARYLANPPGTVLQTSSI